MKNSTRVIRIKNGRRIKLMNYVKISITVSICNNPFVRIFRIDRRIMIIRFTVNINV